MNRQGTAHCVACGNCRERHDVFREAGGVDLTEYADPANIS
jgi:7-cyano-7-deazaguanine synthase in queuosine biosynthesis